MRKLLQICVEGNIGSTGRIAESVGNLAIREGWQSYIAYGRFPRPSNSNLIKIGNNLDILWHGFLTRIFDRHGFGSKKATKRFIKEIEKINPDIIHLHHLHGYYINIEILFDFFSTFNKPVVWTFHDCWSFTGHCAHFDFIGCNKWKNQCYKCPQKLSYPKSYFVDRSFKNYNEKKLLFNSCNHLTIVPVSSWLEKLVKESFLCNNFIHTIKNGIDLSKFYYDRNPITEIKYKVNNNFLILGVAYKWGKRKGLDDFKKLGEILGAEFTILLVGLDESQLKDLPKNIIGIGRTESQHELRELYSRSDVFINTTYEDTYPTTNLEAIACGTPVITYNTGGSVEPINNNTGLIVEKGDINRLSTIVRKMKTEEIVFSRDSCMIYAKNNFDQNDCFGNYIELYDKILTKVVLNQKD